jgi:hypothetical protein
MLRGCGIIQPKTLLKGHSHTRPHKNEAKKCFSWPWTNPHNARLQFLCRESYFPSYVVFPCHFHKSLSDTKTGGKSDTRGCPNSWIMFYCVHFLSLAHPRGGGYWFTLTALNLHAEGHWLGNGRTQYAYHSSLDIWTKNKVRLIPNIPYYPTHLVLRIPKVLGSNLDSEVSFITPLYLLNFGVGVRAQWFCGRRFYYVGRRGNRALLEW